MFAQLRQLYAEFTMASPPPLVCTGTLEPSVTIRYSTEVQSAKTTNTCGGGDVVGGQNSDEKSDEASDDVAFGGGGWWRFLK